MSTGKATPGSGVGGNGIASEFGDLTSFSRTDVDSYLRGLDAKVNVTRSGYTHYRFVDGSEVVIRPDGEVVRIPKPEYDASGNRINKGLRLGKDGSLIRTRDQSGNLVSGVHNTGERVSE